VNRTFINARIVCAALLFLIFSQFIFAGEIDSVYIIHTNDFHGRANSDQGSAGFARIAAFINDKKNERSDVLVLDAGDYTSGTAFSTLFQGESIIRIMSSMGYDAVTLGNHEFDHGWKNIEKLKQISDFPILCANAYKPDGDLLADKQFMFKNVDGVEVGIIGVISEYTPQMVVKSGNENLTFTPVVEKLNELVPEVRDKCDLLIVLSHAGFEKDKQIAETVTGIDIIVGGHDHILLQQPLKVSDTYIVQAHCYGTHVGRIDVNIDCTSRDIVEINGGVIAAVKLPSPDEHIQMLLDSWDKKIADKIDIEIAIASGVVTGIDLLNLIIHAMKEKTSSDLGFYNPGGIRDFIRKGPVTIRHIWKVLPFNNTMVIVKIRGEDVEGPFKDYTSLIGLQLQPDQEYAVVTNNFVGDHAEEYFGQKVLNIKNTQIPVRETVIDHIKSYGLSLKENAEK